MAFSQPTPPWRSFPWHPKWHTPGQKTNLELLGLLAVSLLLILGIITLTWIKPAPVTHESASQVTSPKTLGPVHFSRLQGSTSMTDSISRPLPVSASHPALESALQQLLAGPTTAEKAAGLYSEIPVGTRLLGVSVQNDVVTINLSHEFTQGGGSTSMIQRVEELKDTMQAVEGPKKMKLSIEGKPLTVLGGEGLEISE